MIRPPFSRMADCAMENDGAKRVIDLQLKLTHVLHVSVKITT